MPPETHTPEQRRALQEVYKILRPIGREALAQKKATEPRPVPGVRAQDDDEPWREGACCAWPRSGIERVDNPDLQAEVNALLLLLSWRRARPAEQADQPGAGEVPEPSPCPRCGVTSHNPTDAAEGYCANCAAYRGDFEALPAYKACGVYGCRADVSRWPCGMHGKRRRRS